MGVGNAADRPLLARERAGAPFAYARYMRPSRTRGQASLIAHTDAGSPFSHMPLLAHTRACAKCMTTSSPPVPGVGHIPGSTVGA